MSVTGRVLLWNALSPTITEVYLHMVGCANGEREYELTTPPPITRINGTRQRQLSNWSAERKEMLRVGPGIAIL